MNLANISFQPVQWWIICLFILSATGVIIVYVKRSRGYKKIPLFLRLLLLLFMLLLIFQPAKLFSAHTTVPFLSIWSFFMLQLFEHYISLGIFLIFLWKSIETQLIAIQYNKTPGIITKIVINNLVNLYSFYVPPGYKIVPLILQKNTPYLYNKNHKLI